MHSRKNPKSLKMCRKQSATKIHRLDSKVAESLGFHLNRVRTWRRVPLSHTRTHAGIHKHTVLKSILSEVGCILKIIIVICSC